MTGCDKGAPLAAVVQCGGERVQILGHWVWQLSRGRVLGQCWFDLGRTELPELTIWCVAPRLARDE